MQTFRQAFSGEGLGGAYVDGCRLDAHGYRMSVVMGVQPEMAGFMFADAEIAGGTPQRFVWLATIDPDAPELDDLNVHPGPLKWMPPSITDGSLRTLATTVTWLGQRWILNVDQSIRDELRESKRAGLLGHSAELLDAHIGLVQLKLAAALAVLDGRVDVNTEDWKLARMIIATSRGVQRWMLRRVAAMNQRQADAANHRAADRAEKETVGRAAATADLNRIAAVIGRHVHRHGEDDGCRTRCITQAVRSNDRQEMTGALGLAVNLGWVVDHGDHFLPGPSHPAGTQR